MDKKLIFLLIFAFACTKDDLHYRSHRVTISNANPIQFWLTGDDSYNQKAVCGIYPVCYCQPFDCDDTIRLQLSDTDSTKFYDLNIYNSSGSLVYTSAFQRLLKYDSSLITSLQFSNSTFQTSISPWLNAGSAFVENWIWQSNGAIKASSTISGFFSSKFLYQLRPSNTYGLGWPPGTYSITVTGNNSSTGVDPRVNLYFFGSNDAFNNSTQLALNGAVVFGAFSKTFTFTTNNYWNDIGFFAQGDNSVQTKFEVTVNSISITQFPQYDYIYSKTIFDLNFNASSISPSICNQSIQMNIVDHFSSEIVAYSDCIEISTDSQDCTQLLQYSNSSNFAGLDFADESPSPPQFQLRIPAVFFDENYPQEQEDLELSDDTIITLWSKIEGKKLLDIGFMPFYMHKKLQMILMMDNVTIDGVSYRLRDPYQITAPTSKRSALRRAQVMLSEKDFINRNLL